MEFPLPQALTPNPSPIGRGEKSLQIAAAGEADVAEMFDGI
jgi:hypothetical protein